MRLVGLNLWDFISTENNEIGVEYPIFIGYLHYKVGF